MKTFRAKFSFSCMEMNVHALNLSYGYSVNNEELTFWNATFLMHSHAEFGISIIITFLPYLSYIVTRLL